MSDEHGTGETSDPREDRRRRRSGMRLANLNGLMWAVGNGLVSTTLVSYLAQALGAEGAALSWLLAAPYLVGVLRLGTPEWMRRVGNRKVFCVAGFSASCLVLLVVPLAGVDGWLPSPAWGLTVLVGAWSFYHLLQYVASAALWTWLADLAPWRVRGRFFGRRERWMMIGTAAAMLASGWFTSEWKAQFPEWKWQGYAVSAAVGALVMLASAAPLLGMPEVGKRQREEGFPPQKDVAESEEDRPDGAWRRLRQTVGDQGFWPLLAYSAYLPLVNGLTQAPLFRFPYAVLGMSLGGLLALRVGMTLGQTAVGPKVGAWIDRFGCRRVLAASQTLAALALWFYIPATAEQPWWIAGAWVFWIAYAGLNIGLPSLLLKTAAEGRQAEYVSVYFALNGLFHAVGTLAGGALLDRFGGQTWLVFGATVSYFPAAFFVGGLLRLLGVPLLFLIDERRPPGR